MGSLTEKLQKIKETKNRIKEVLQSKLVDVSDNDTFASYPNKCATLINSADIVRLIVDFKGTQPTKKFTDEIGTVSVSKYICFPKALSFHYGECALKLNSFRLGSLNIYDYIDLSGIECDDGEVYFFAGCLEDTTAKTLVFPSCDIYLGSNVITYSELDSDEFIADDFFSRGLIFRGNVIGCNSSWMRCTAQETLKTNNNRVILPNDFTGTLYLSKLLLTKTNMVNMFNKLKDISSTGETGKLILGATNLSKLTTAQKNIAYAKGWTLS